MSVIVKNSGDKNNGLNVWEKLTAGNGDFIKFVVSDDPSKYPDGDTLGEYRYEKIKQIIKPKYFGCSKMAIDTYTPSYNNAVTNNVSHSLGEIPKVIIIFTEALENAENSNILSLLFSIVDNSGRANGVVSAINKNARVINYFYNNESNYLKCTSSTIVFYLSGVHAYKAGQKYTVITMA